MRGENHSQLEKGLFLGVLVLVDLKAWEISAIATIGQELLTQEGKIWIENPKQKSL